VNNSGTAKLTHDKKRKALKFEKGGAGGMDVARFDLNDIPNPGAEFVLKAKFNGIAIGNGWFKVFFYDRKGADLGQGRDVKPLRGTFGLREIELNLKDAPAGFIVSGGRIPAGCDMIDITLAAPYKPSVSTFALTFQGQAKIAGQTVTRQAVPADDRMQAFLFRHLVPTQQLLVAVLKKGGRLPIVNLVGRGPVRLKPGGSAEVKLTMPGKRGAMTKGIKLALHQPPEGITLGNVKILPRGLSFVLKAEKDALAKGFEGNLIVEALREYTPKGKKGQPAKAKKKYSVGALPAIPVVVTAQ
jgi:hypothetical protein